MMHFVISSTTCPAESRFRATTLWRARTISSQIAIGSMPKVEQYCMGSAALRTDGEVDFGGH